MLYIYFGLNQINNIAFKPVFTSYFHLGNKLTNLGASCLVNVIAKQKSLVSTGDVKYGIGLTDVIIQASTILIVRITETMLFITKWGQSCRSELHYVLNDSIIICSNSLV